MLSFVHVRQGCKNICSRALDNKVAMLKTNESSILLECKLTFVLPEGMDKVGVEAAFSLATGGGRVQLVF